MSSCCREDQAFEDLHSNKLKRRAVLLTRHGPSAFLRSSYLLFLRSEMGLGGSPANSNNSFLWAPL